jgi:hypothetical protein
MPNPSKKSVMDQFPTWALISNVESRYQNLLNIQNRSILFDGSETYHDIHAAGHPIHFHCYEKLFPFITEAVQKLCIVVMHCALIV